MWQTPAGAESCAGEPGDTYPTNLLLQAFPFCTHQKCTIYSQLALHPYDTGGKEDEASYRARPSSSGWSTLTGSSFPGFQAGSLSQLSLEMLEIEPKTSYMQSNCSTTELCPRVVRVIQIQQMGSWQVVFSSLKNLLDVFVERVNLD